MRLRSDDDVARYRAVFLGFRGKTFFFRARYLAYGVAAALTVAAAPLAWLGFVALDVLPWPVTAALGALASWPVSGFVTRTLLGSVEDRTARLVGAGFMRTVFALVAAMLFLVAGAVPAVLSLPLGPALAVFATREGLRHVDHDRPLAYWRQAFRAEITGPRAQRVKRWKPVLRVKTTKEATR